MIESHRQGRPAPIERRASITIALATAAALVLIFSVAAPAEKQAQKPSEKAAKPAKAKKPAGPPKLRARAWILIDALDGTELAASAPNRELAIASETKLMTTYLALKRLKPSERLTAPAYAPSSSDESLLGLHAGEKITVKDLLYAMLLPSANDAAETVALGIGGSEKRFVTLMNHAAPTVGLDHTHYQNPIGLDATGNYSSARDLVTLADRLLENPLFARIVATPSATLHSGDMPRKITTRNTLMLEHPDLVIGVKTGHTLEAGYVLVAAARRNGATLLSAVLGTSSESARDAESLKLLEYGLSMYRALRPVHRGEKLADPSLDYRDEHLELVAKREIPASVRRGQRVKVEVDAPDEISGSVEKGETLGRVVVTVDGRVEGTSPLIASEDVAAATVAQKAISTVVKPLILIPAGACVILVGLLLASRGRGKPPEGAEEPEEAIEPMEAEHSEEANQVEAPAAPDPQASRRRLRRKGPAARTPEERRAMHDERMRRRRGREK